MGAAVASRDPIADRFEETEKRLNEWSDACRRNSETLGMPTISNIAQMVAHVRRQERMQKGVRKKRLRKKHAEQRKRHEPLDAKEIAEIRGYLEPELTARGKQNNSPVPRRLQVSSHVAQIDYIVRRLPDWMHTTITRSYLYRQSDRSACQDLRIRKEVYRQQREAAVDYVSECLSMHRSHPGR